jgi:hypothetical protein
LKILDIHREEFKKSLIAERGFLIVLLDNNGWNPAFFMI